MISRRQFLKTSAAAAALLGIREARALGARSVGTVVPEKSRVVLAQDPLLRDDFGDLIPSRVESLLDRAVFTYTGISQPTVAWKSIVGKSRRVGIKVDGRGGKEIATHALLVNAIVRRLEEAEIRPEHIVIWDATATGLEACGFTLNERPGTVQCLSSETEGYEETPETWGTARVRLSKILTRACDMVIAVPTLKDDPKSGVGFAMESMYGVVADRQQLEALGCCPGLADLNCIPTIREKVRFTIGDALSGIYDGGPSVHLDRLWSPDTLLLGADRVAMDEEAWQMIDERRKEAGLKSLAAVGRAPRYLEVAADAEHALGNDDAGRIELARI
ncbi:MAG: DUF362 domain-containing protein [Acidobacteriota bacterium]